jgi:alkyl hydroperoxide reductase subunit AhpC
MRCLQVGQIAPNFEAKAVFKQDVATINLSDYLS